MDIWKANRADIAVDLIERYGFCVFPAEPDSKAPATSRGVKDASNDTDVVRSWFTSIPDANIATATGEPSKITVVDIDPQNDQDAFLNASELIGLDDLGQPETMIVDTPSGGQHWYFSWPGFPVKNKVGIVPGVDIKGDGGYVIAAGSTIGKARYSYSLDSPIAELPEVLKLRLTEGVSEPKSEWRDLQGIVVAEGERNHALTRFAGALWNASCTTAELFAALKERNAMYQPPLPEKEVQRIASSAERNFDRSPASTSQGMVGIDYNDLMRLPLPAVDFLLLPVVARGGLTLIHAAPGIGKTTLAIGMAVAVATGSDFLEWRVGGAGRVLFIDGEMTANVMQERFQAAVDGRIVEANQLMIATPDLVLAQGTIMPDLGTPEGQLIVDQGIPADTRFVIVDNISSLVRTGDENFAEFWTFVQSWALSHRAAGRSLLFVHHDNKGANSYRGTSKIADTMDTVIHLTRPDDYEPDQGARFVVSTTKSRLATALPDFEAWLTAKGWSIQRCKNKAEQALEMRSLGMRNKDIAAELAVHPSTVGRWLNTATFEKAIP